MGNCTSEPIKYTGSKPGFCLKHFWAHDAQTFRHDLPTRLPIRVHDKTVYDHAKAAYYELMEAFPELKRELAD